MSDYLSVDEARTMSGMRLVLSRDAPGPWGEAARIFFELKKIPYVRVSQHLGLANENLKEWTGHSNAPTAVYNDETPYATWFGILYLAERLAPTPALIPQTETARAQMFGLCHEICGEDGLSWNRRLLLMQCWDKYGTEQDQAMRHKIKSTYGYNDQSIARAKQRVIDIVKYLGPILHHQKQDGSPYLVGRIISAADIYLATAMVLFHPLPEEKCPMGAGYRMLYSENDPDVLAAIDPVLTEHRDYLYANHLSLPLHL